MRGRLRKLAALALVLAGVGLLGGCGDDEPTGPRFGDLVFTPSSTVLTGDERSAMLILRNSGPRDLGPIIIGKDQIVFRTAFTDSLCAGVEAAFVPSSISSLAQGAEADVALTLNLSGVVQATCSPGEYNTSVLASVNQQVLASASIRFDWDGTPP